MALSAARRVLLYWQTVWSHAMHLLGGNERGHGGLQHAGVLRVAEQDERLRQLPKRRQRRRRRRQRADVRCQRRLLLRAALPDSGALAGLPAAMDTFLIPLKTLLFRYMLLYCA